LRRIAVMTSGGDAPGMNAAIRAVVRVALHCGLEVRGVRRGYAGLLAGQTEELSTRSVGGIIQRGGTVLGTAREAAMLMPDGPRQALDVLHREGIDGLVVIGGDGSLRGALALHRLGFPVVGVPASIDNDIYGTDLAIGVDTALNTALEAIDRIKETASSHNRAFIVELMGRHSGYLALTAGLAGGAEMVLIPEVEVDPARVVQELREAYARGKPHFIVVVAEGARYNAARLQQYIEHAEDEVGFETRLTVLGHVLRGGAPTVHDRLLASRLGAEAVAQLAAGVSGVMVGLVKGAETTTDLETVTQRIRAIDPEIYRLADILAA